MRQYFTAEERAGALAATAPEPPLSKDQEVVMERDCVPAKRAQRHLTFAEWMALEELTYRQAAERLGVSRPTIYNWKTKGAPERILEQINGRAK